MFKVSTRIMLLVLLVVALTLTSLQPVNAALFTYLEGHWACEPICRANVVDLINCYPD